MGYAALSHLGVERQQRHDEEEQLVTDMVEAEEFDIEQRGDYKYTKATASELGWSVGRLTKVTDRMISRMKTIESAIKRAQEARGNEEERAEG